MHHEERILAELAEIKALLVLIARKETFDMSKLSDALADLKAQVQADTDATNGAITLIQGLASQIADAATAGDLQAVADLAAQVKSNAAALAGAVTANTPAAPPATP